MMLYKYRAPVNFSNPDSGYTARIFIDSQLYFAKLSTFNDPFEGLIELEVHQSKEEAIDRHFRVLRSRERARDVLSNPFPFTWNNAKSTIDKIFEKVIAGEYIDHNKYYKEVMDDYGVLALCENPDNLLLWAHYATEHRGLCLGFEWAETKLPKAEEVIYQTNYRKIDFWFHTEDELAQIALLQKSSDWSYEREHRSIWKPLYEEYEEFRPDENYFKKLKEIKDSSFLKEQLKRDYTFAYQRVKNVGHGAKTFQKNSLKEVIFGLRMTKNERKQHIDFITSLGYRPEFKIAKRATEQYKLQITSA
ncbi:DUF2971 domain-containing protein [Pleurocapsa sp. PCC 7319]|uniref:DUF2971 domain-containing protein n=1 Tax=Pleurocapsa sp. PCC 7319 TaxID=118161 RepID=UPI00037A9CF7|nr:DUF2971 domain-containing protein [Pleurocapsa sp. PCC 7319]